MALYEKQWFINLINFCNKWDWFKTNIYGQYKTDQYGNRYISTDHSIEDFLRNPAEVFRDNHFPFTVLDVKAVSLLAIRSGYTIYNKQLESEYVNQCCKVFEENGFILIDGYYEKTKPDGSKLRFYLFDYKYTYWKVPYEGKETQIGDYTRNINWLHKWVTKWPNGKWSLNISVVLWKGWFPLPYLSFHIRTSEVAYFQFGIGWAPEGKITGSWYKDLTCYERACGSIKCRIGDYIKELEFNPGSEVYGFWEGTI